MGPQKPPCPGCDKREDIDTQIRVAPGVCHCHHRRRNLSRAPAPLPLPNSYIYTKPVLSPSPGGVLSRLPVTLAAVGVSPGAAGCPLPGPGMAELSLHPAGFVPSVPRLISVPLKSHSICPVELPVMSPLGQEALTFTPFVWVFFFFLSGFSF